MFLCVNHWHSEEQSYLDLLFGKCILRISSFRHNGGKLNGMRCLGNNLFQINPTVGDFYVWTSLSRREEIVIARACIGHTISHTAICWKVKICPGAFHVIVLILIYFIYLFGVLRRFQHCTGHIMTGSWKGRGNQCIQFVRVLYCKLPTNGKQLPAFPLEAVPGIEPWPQRWEAKVLPLCHRGPFVLIQSSIYY